MARRRRKKILFQGLFWPPPKAGAKKYKQGVRGPQAPEIFLGNFKGNFKFSLGKTEILDFFFSENFRVFLGRFWVRAAGEIFENYHPLKWPATQNYHPLKWSRQLT